MNQTKFRVNSKLNLISIIIENPNITLNELIKYSEYKDLNSLKKVLGELIMVGSYPYTPLDFIDIDYTSNDTIKVNLPTSLEQTLGLNVEEWSLILNILDSERKIENIPIQDKEIYNSIIDKLKPIIPFSNFETNRDTRRIIEEAITEKKIIQFKYLGRKDTQLEVKKVVPFFIFSLNEEYLMGVYPDSETRRFFRLSNINEIQLTNEKYTQEIPFESKNEIIKQLESFVQNSANSSEDVELLIDLEIEYNLSKLLNFSIIKKIENQLHIKTKLIEENWFLDIIKTFGSKIKIISPKEFKENYLTYLKDCLNSK
jgi:hypothetical protein